jgi:hypothetical protein
LKDGHGAAVSVALMGLCGCVVAPLPQALIINNDSANAHVYLLTDPNFAAVVFGNIEILPKIDGALFSFMLRSMQSILFDTPRSTDARLRQQLARSFSCNKIQLAKARIARNFIVTLTSEENCSLSLSHVAALQEFLFLYFTSDDGLGRTSAAEDDFEFLASAVAFVISRFVDGVDAINFADIYRRDNMAACVLVSLFSQVNVLF